MTIPSLKSLVGVDLAGPLMGIARHYAWTIPIVAGLGMVTSALESFGVGLLIPLLGLFSADLNAVSVPASLTFLLQIPAWFSDSHRLVALAGLIVLVIAVRSVLDFVNLALVVWLDGKAGHDIRLELADRLLRYGYGFFLQHNPMRLVNIVSTDSWRATEAIQIVFTMVAALGSVTVFSLFLIIIDWRLFLVLVLGEGAIRWLSSVIDKKLDPMSERVTGSNEVLGERMYLIAATLFKVIRIFRAERYELARFEAASDGTRRARLRIGILSSIVGPGLEVLQAILFVGILLGAHQGGIGLTVLVAFLLLARRTQPHLRSISEGYSHLATLAASVREVEWLLNPKDKPVGPRGSVPYRRLEREIRFDNVTFAYGPTPDQAPALIDASFAIAAGTATAVIGRSGSGKSTVVALLCRLIEPQAGAILVDGTSLSELEPSSWLDRLGVAGQDIELVDASVTENIAYGLEGISKDEIVRAATLADAHEFILRLPKGYDTPIGMRGLSLSGGQRQRIGIARALVRKPDILILDEATNAVDVISEAAVMSLIKARAGHSTTIVISHRQSTLELCETVVALQAGRAIAEFAKPREQREWASEHLL